MERLQQRLHKVSHHQGARCLSSLSRVDISTLSLQGVSGGTEEADASQLREKLAEAQNEASATKEELNSCKESLEKLQELLQVKTCSHIQVNYSHRLFPVVQHHIMMQFAAQEDSQNVKVLFYLWLTRILIEPNFTF